MRNENFKLKAFAVLAFSAVLIGCGGGGGGGSAETPDEEVRTVRISVAAPSAVDLASLEPDMLERMGEFLLNPAYAEAEQVPVENARLSIEIIIPGPPATTQPLVEGEDFEFEDLGNGQYELNLIGDNAGLRVDCIVVSEADINGGGTLTLRAPFASTSINVSAASEFLTREIESNVESFDNISLDEIRAQVAQIEGIAFPDDVDTVEEALELLEEAVGETVRDEIAAAEADDTDAGVASDIAGRFNGGWAGMGMEGNVGENNGPFGEIEVFASDFKLQLNNAGGDELSVPVFDTDDVFANLTTSDNQNYFFFGEVSSEDNDFDSTDRFFALDDGSFLFPAESEIQVGSDEDPEADIFSSRQTRFFPSGDGEFYVGTYAEREAVYGAIDSDGDNVPDAANLDDQREQYFSREIIVAAREPASLSNSDFTGNYWLVFGAGEISRGNGEVEACADALLLSISNAVITEEIAYRGACIDRFGNNGQVNFEEELTPIPNNTGSIGIGANGAITFNLTEGAEEDVEVPGFATEGGRYFTVHPLEDDSDFDFGEAELGQGIALRALTTLPENLDGTTFRTRLMELTLDGSATEIGFFDDGIFTINVDEAGISLDVSRTQDFIRREQDNGAPVLEREEESFTETGGENLGNGHLRFTTLDGFQIDLYLGDDLGLMLGTVSFDGTALNNNATVGTFIGTPITVEEESSAEEESSSESGEATEG